MCVLAHNLLRPPPPPPQMKILDPPLRRYVVSRTFRLEDILWIHDTGRILELLTVYTRISNILLGVIDSLNQH